LGSPKRTSGGNGATAIRPAPVQVEGRHARKRRATEERLLDAALTVFLERGYDGATTGEIARAADVAAGTFYLHFRDKRAAYEQLCRRAAHELLTQWRTALKPGRPMVESVALALRLTADYWRADPQRAQLLLEGGPSLGSIGHVRILHDITAVLAANASDGRPTTRAIERQAHAYALVGLGMSIELGRLIVAQPDSAQEVEDLLRLVRGMLPIA
jgi:AcrR family transcriptional regulator